MFAFGHVEANLLVGNAGSRHVADRFPIRSAIVEPSRLGAAGGEKSPAATLRRLRLLPTGQNLCRYTGQHDCRGPVEFEAGTMSHWWGIQTWRLTSLADAVCRHTLPRT